MDGNHVPTLDDADMTALVDEEMVKSQFRTGRLETLASWHGEPSFWREVYTRTIGGLGAALGLSLVALVVFSVQVEGAGLFYFASLALVAAVCSGAASYFAGSLRRRRQNKPAARLVPHAIFGMMIFVGLLVFIGFTDKVLLARN